MNKNTNMKPQILENIGNNMPIDTIFNHYETPMAFKQDCERNIGDTSEAKDYTNEGIKAWNDFIWDSSYENIYKDVHEKVKDKLISRGFTTKMLYGTPEFTSEKTGIISKQRALMGMRECYIKGTAIDDGNMFHDIFINLSYSWGTDQNSINKKAMSMYALTKELSRFIKVRVFIVNWVHTRTPTCYSYPVKRYGEPINKKEFVFFTSMSKRTYGWGHNFAICQNTSIGVGRPDNTVSLVNVSLDSIIDDIWDKTASLRKAYD